METVEISKATLETLEHILNVSDLSSDERTLSKSDIVAIGVEMYRLACMTAVMNSMAVDVWAIASNIHNANKGNQS